MKNKILNGLTFVIAVAVMAMTFQGLLGITPAATPEATVQLED